MDLSENHQHPIADTDIYTPSKRSCVMSSVRTKGTKPELAVRAALDKLGIKYGINCPDLPGKPDLVLEDERLVVFVHGCFWHGHSCAKGMKRPMKNREFWTKKITQTKERDVRKIGALVESGWKVEIIWECQTKRTKELQMHVEFMCPGHYLI